MNKSPLGIVAPVYNEITRIAPTFDEVDNYSRRRPDWHFLFVDDGSYDGMGEYLEAILTKHGLLNIDLKRRLLNGGTGLSIKEGLARMNKERVYFTDGDLAYSEDHLDVLEKALASYDMVIGNLNLIEQHDYISLRSLILGEGFNRLIRIILGLPYRDTQASLKGFRAHVKDVIKSSQWLTSSTFDVE